MNNHVVYNESADLAAAHAAVGESAALTGSGVSWGAVLGGAAAAAALSFILLILGFGLGFSSVSPWSGEGLSAKTIGISGAIWLVFTQLAASAIGGYLAGRLRVKWAGVHTREVYFRDTAHGFLAWSVATLVTAAVLGTAISSVISGGVRATGAAVTAVGGAGAAAAGAAGSNRNIADAASGYFIDGLFRASGTAAPAAPGGAPAPVADAAPLALPAARGPDEGRDGTSPAQRMEVARIFTYALSNGELASADRTYVAQVVAARTGLSQADAEKRVNDTFAAYKKSVDDAATKTREAADAARKAAAYGSMWMFLSLLCGAFIASFSATYGGRRRDLPDFAAPRAVAPSQPVVNH
jgi:hypothetical protein